MVLEKVCEYFYYNEKNRDSTGVADLDIPPELCLELLMAADYLNGVYLSAFSATPFILLTCLQSDEKLRIFTTLLCLPSKHTSQGVCGVHCSLNRVVLQLCSHEYHFIHLQRLTRNTMTIQRQQYTPLDHEHIRRHLHSSTMRRL
jgi:hypothetical protein